jgi:hypothetical protein
MTMKKTMLPLPHPHPTQLAVLGSKARFRVVVCGRRWGKTTIGMREILYHAFFKHEACWWLSPTYAMAEEVWRELKTAGSLIPGAVISETDRRIDFPGGGWLAIHSTHTADNLRGAGLDFVVLDEAAFMGPHVWPEVVRPMLLERKGRALFLSSPNGRNWFWELYQLGVRRARSWQAFHFTAFDNPQIAPEELATIQAQTPERVWRQEYLAEFTDAAGQVFRGIQEAATAPADAQPVEGRRYAIGLDWGREGDYTALAVIDAETQQMVALDRFNQVSWALQRGRVRALYERWGASVIWAEANSIGAPNIEALQAEGLPVRPFVTTAQSKPALIEALALAIERGEIGLLADETLLSELSTYTLERLPAGGYRYSAPAGLHDDLVIATALAWHGARYSGVLIEFA